MRAHEAAAASSRVNPLVFGAVDFTRDMQIRITPTATDVARAWTAIAARSAGLTSIDAPWPEYTDVEGFRKDRAYGRCARAWIEKYHSVAIKLSRNLRVCQPFTAPAAKPFTIYL